MRGLLVALAGLLLVALVAAVPTVCSAADYAADFDANAQTLTATATPAVFASEVATVEGVERVDAQLASHRRPVRKAAAASLRFTGRAARFGGRLAKFPLRLAGRALCRGSGCR